MNGNERQRVHWLLTSSPIVRQRCGWRQRIMSLKNVDLQLLCRYFNCNIVGLYYDGGIHRQVQQLNQGTPLMFRPEVEEGPGMLFH